MKKISRKIFATMMCCSCAAVLLLGSISIQESTSITKKNEEEMLVWMTRYYAAQFSRQFEVIENQVEELALSLTSTIDMKEMKDNPEYLPEYEKFLAPIVERFAKERTDGIAGWIYFDPKWSETPHDVYYVDGDADGIPDRQNYIPFSYYDNKTTPTDDKYWWYGPIAEKQGVWTNPYEWTLKNGEVIKVVSYALPVYVDGEFVAVVGTYYRFDDMSRQIKEIKIYDTGYATLFNEKLDVIVHPQYFAGTRETSDNLRTVEENKYEDACNTLMNSSSGLLFNEGGGNNMLAYSKLSNGWTLTIKPKMDEMYSGVYRLIYLLLATVAGSLILSSIVSYIMGRLITKPILKVTRAAEAIGGGDFSVSLQINTKDEIKTLADSMNSMVQNIKSLQNDTEQLAYYDELTGIRNLTKFKIDAKELLTSHPELHYIMIKMDIDQFKIFNDLHGFEEGDRLLKSIAKTAESILDDQLELIARINSDEFVILVLYDGIEELEKQQAQFEKLFIKDYGVLAEKVVFPIGRCQIIEGQTDVAAIFEMVNLAHRLAKQKPVPKVCDYDHSVREIALREKAIETQQVSALENNEFLLYLQPKYRLSDETVVGAEGLVRWKSASLGMVFPNNFIPLFEKNGFITQMDMYMFEKTCQALQSWIEEGMEPVVVSVNFSRLHLGNRNLVEQLCNIADRYNVPRNLLEIELTESAMFDHGDILVSFLTSLHDAGFTLSMDDFGTGYSSLGLLKNLPVDVMKLDRSFFVDAIDEEREQAVISSVIAMAKKLNIHTVAEGVEDKEHVDFLRKLGCDIVQGYYYAKPMPETEFTEGLRKEWK